MQIANNFDEFIERVSEAERKALNMPAGQKMTQKLLEMKLAANPNLTPEEWQQTKNEHIDLSAALLPLPLQKAKVRIMTGENFKRIDRGSDIKAIKEKIFM